MQKRLTLEFVRSDHEDAVARSVWTVDDPDIATCFGLPDCNPRAFSTGTILTRRLKHLFNLFFGHIMIINMGTARGWVDIEPNPHLSRLYLDNPFRVPQVIASQSRLTVELSGASPLC